MAASRGRSRTASRQPSRVRRVPWLPAHSRLRGSPTPKFRGSPVVRVSLGGRTRDSGPRILARAARKAVASTHAPRQTQRTCAGRSSRDGLTARASAPSHAGQSPIHSVPDCRSPSAAPHVIRASVVVIGDDQRSHGDPASAKERVVGIPRMPLTGTSRPTGTASDGSSRKRDPAPRCAVLGTAASPIHDANSTGSCMLMTTRRLWHAARPPSNTPRSCSGPHAVSLRTTVWRTRDGAAYPQWRATWSSVAETNEAHCSMRARRRSNRSVRR